MSHQTELPANFAPPDDQDDLQAVLPHLHEVIYALNTGGASPIAGKVEFIGGPVEDLIGPHPEAISGQPGAWLDLIHPEDRAEVERSTRIILERRKPVIREYRLRNRATGDYHRVMDRGVPRLDGRGKVIRILGILTDITSQRQATADLYDANRLLQGILDHTSLLLAYLDKDLNFLLVNRAYASADQHEPDYYVGKNHFDLFPNAENEAIFRRVLQTGELHYALAKPFEYTANPERGVTYWDWALVPVKDQGSVVGVVLTLLNVTQHVQTAQRLGYSESLLKQAQQIAHIGSWTLDMTTGKLEWSDEMYRIHGRTRDSVQAELTMPLVLSWIHPDDQARVQADFSRVQRQGEMPTPQEFRILRPDGETRTVLLQTVISKEENGTSLKFTGVMQDITERKQAEAVLRQSEQLFSAIFNQSLIGITIGDPADDNRWVNVNEAFLKIIGYEREEIIGRTSAELNLIQEREKIMRDVHQVGSYGNAERVVRTKSGSLKHVRGSGTVIQIGDKKYLLSMVEDITEFTKAQEQIKFQARLLTIIPDAIITVNPSNLITTWNEGAEILYGWQAQEVLGKNAADIVATEFPPNINRSLLVEMLQRGETWRGEVTQLRRDGTKIPVLSSLAPIMDSSGQYQGVVAVNRDIAERKQLEQTLRDYTNHLEEANTELETLSALKDEFVSNVSHELRTPIANLELREHLLQQHPERIDTHLPVIKRETGRLARTIEALLRLSRLDQNRLDVHLQPLDLNALIAEYVVDLSELALEKSVQLAFLPGKSLPQLSADPAMITQTLTILIDNAFNYVPASGSITIKTGVHKKKTVWFSVANSGPTIPPQEREKIFERFYRGSINQQKHVPGTGLGLAIARELITRQGGTIEAGGDEGAVFTVKLPLG